MTVLRFNGQKHSVPEAPHAGSWAALLHLNYWLYLQQQANNGQRKARIKRLNRAFLLRGQKHRTLYCAYCGKTLFRYENDVRRRDSATVDHWIPLGVGGDIDSHNLICSCPKCNSDKGMLNPVTDLEFWTEFLPSRPIRPTVIHPGFDIRDLLDGN